MTPLALALVLCAAFIHALWNLIAKKAGGGAGFVWLLTLTSCVVYCPLGLWFFWHSRGIPLLAWILIGSSSVIHIAYFLSLQHGYRVGELSVVYPIARGTGPLLAALAGVVLLGERPGWLAIAGAVGITGGVFVLGGSGSRSETPNKVNIAAVYGFVTGVLIALYTVIDKVGVSSFGVSAILYDWLSNCGRAVLLTPYGLKRLDSVRADWRDKKKAIVTIGIASPLAYILVLTAMSFTPVSYVAPARELSILIGIGLGGRVLNEGRQRRRLLGAVLMLGGFLALVVGHVPSL